MINKKSRNTSRQKRHLRIRQFVKGTEARPRLNVFRSNKNITAQIIDDAKGVTLVSASSLTLGLENGSNVAAATAVGKAVAELAVSKGIKVVVFDRGGYLYHGRVKALADAAREAGLEF